MKQADLGLSLTTKSTRKREFLTEMERVVPWAALVDLITHYAPQGKGTVIAQHRAMERALEPHFEKAYEMALQCRLNAQT